MSLSTYSGLKTAVAALLNRTDLTDYIPDWITMAEAVFNRKLKTRETVVTSTFTINSETYTLPEGFAGVESFWLDKDTGYALEYVTLDQFDNVTDTPGTPQYYTISGNDFYFAPPPGGDFSVRLRYQKKITPLAEDTDTNWLLSNHPDVYLYGAAVHSAPFLNDDARIVMWQGKHDSIIEETNREYARSDRGSRLQTRSGIVDRGFTANGYAGWR